MTENDDIRETTPEDDMPDTPPMPPSKDDTEAPALPPARVPWSLSIGRRHQAALRPTG